MLLLKKNPVESLANWQSIALVINKGNVINPDSVVKYTPSDLADQQLVAYNAHNLEAFLEPYSNDIEIYDLTTNKLRVKGKEAMRAAYAFLNTAKIRYCNVQNRIVQSDVVIDHEEVWIDGGQKFYGVAIYQISHGKIIKVWFQ